MNESFVCVDNSNSKRSKKNNTTPQQIGQDNSLSVGPLACRYTRKRNSWPIGKKRHHPSKQTPPNFETIKRII